MDTRGIRILLIECCFSASSEGTSVCPAARISIVLMVAGMDGCGIMRERTIPLEWGGLEGELECDGAGRIGAARMAGSVASDAVLSAAACSVHFRCGANACFGGCGEIDVAAAGM